MIRAIALSVLVSFVSMLAHADGPAKWVTYEGREGPGHGKHIVFVTGDDEYRSEESMPQLAKILAVRHGFKCTVLFAINKDTGAIDPATLDNIPGLEQLDTADLMILFLRFRELPDDQMTHIMDYTNSGKPIMALRTSTHPFFYKDIKSSPYSKWNWTSPDPKGGYGREVLGETWVNHYGNHKVQSTRGIVAPGMEKNPIVQGCEDIWGPSDVYEVTTLSGDGAPLILGQVLTGMNPTDKPADGKKELPIAWTKTYTGTSGKPSRVFTTTMGHSFDLHSEGFRRLLVNAAYWSIGIEDQIPARADVAIVGEYTPIDIGFGTHRVGIMPESHVLGAEAP